MLIYTTRFIITVMHDLQVIPLFVESQLYRLRLHKARAPHTKPYTM